MTRPTESGRSGPFAGNGVQVIFVVTFEFEDETHLQVIQTVSATGVETVKVLTTDYTVSGTNVTMVVAPPSGETLLIIRNVPFTQESDYSNTGGADQEVIETDFDLTVDRVLQIDELQKRQLSVPASSILSESQLEIPDPALTANRAKFLSTKSDGTGVELVENITSGISVSIGAGDAGKLLKANATENGIEPVEDDDIISENIEFSGALDFSGTPAAGAIAERVADAGVTIDGALIKDGFSPFTTSFITGFVPSHAADTDFDMAITAGQCRDLADGQNVLSTITFIKQIDATWVAGNDMGGHFSGAAALGNNLDFHAILIEQDSTPGNFDWGFDDNITGANAPAGWTARRRLFSIRTDGSANIVNNAWREKAGGAVEAFLMVPIFELHKTYLGGADDTAQTGTLAFVPGGIQVEAILGVVMLDITADAESSLLVTSLDTTDTAPVDLIATWVGQLFISGPGTTDDMHAAAELRIRTSTSRTFRFRIDESTTAHRVTFVLIGFIDERR